jgi:prepilin-type N-terminal cleavage/methylation domain-containing protein
MKKSKGMSLVEILIAVFLLSIALLAIASSFASSTSLMAHTVDREKATLLAVEIMDYIGSQIDTDQTDDWGLSYDDLKDSLEDPAVGIVVIPSIFTLEPWNVASVASNDHLKIVNLTITWNGVGQNNSVVLERAFSPFASVNVD